MIQSPYILRECPVCGRPVWIGEEHFGREVVCRHCGGRLRAGNRAAPLVRRDQPDRTLLERADRLLCAATRRLKRLAERSAIGTASAGAEC
ncbi:MAG: hypothetical protein JW818_12425 [Pirellulales bacterium]|nr:hypothetical protein [Pirellulales bacterium]